MLIDKYFHLYGRKADIVFEEIPKPQEIELKDLDLFCRQRGLTVISNELYAEMKARWSAPPKPQWIPCSERVPMVSGEFLVTLTDGDGEWVSTAEWNTTFGGRWQDIFIDDGYRDISNVIAWMPLPEPYGGKQDE